MKDTINTLLNHRSIRSYKQDPVDEEDLNVILQAAQSAPSSINGQHVSIIVVRDKQKKGKIAELAGGQRYIDEAGLFLVFCLDFYRAKLACEKHNEKIAIVDNLESTLIGTLDVGLAMENTIIASEALGYGIVPIGGVRGNISEIVKLLELPEYVFPVCGLVVGVIADPSAVKPRLPKEAVIHNEKYNPDIMDSINQYDEIMKNYMLARTNGQNDRNWTQSMANYYKKPSSRDVSLELKKQGFLK